MVRFNRSFVTADELQRQIDSGANFFAKAYKKAKKLFEFITGTDQEKMLVDVTMLRTAWIFRGREQGEHKNFDKFIETLA